MNLESGRLIVARLKMPGQLAKMDRRRKKDPRIPFALIFQEPQPGPWRTAVFPRVLSAVPGTRRRAHKGFTGIALRRLGYRAACIALLIPRNNEFCYCEGNPTYPARTRVHHRDTGYDRSRHRPASR